MPVYHCRCSLIPSLPFWCLLQFAFPYRSLFWFCCYQHSRHLLFIPKDWFGAAICDRIVKPFCQKSCDNFHCGFFSSRTTWSLICFLESEPALILLLPTISLHVQCSEEPTQFCWTAAGVVFYPDLSFATYLLLAFHSIRATLLQLHSVSNRALNLSLPTFSLLFSCHWRQIQICFAVTGQVCFKNSALQLLSLCFPILSNYSTALFFGIRACFHPAVTSILLAFSLSLKTDTVLQGSWPGFALGLLYHYSFPFRILCLSSCLFITCFLVSEVAESLLLPVFSSFLLYPEGWIQFRKITISL